VLIVDPELESSLNARNQLILCILYFFVEFDSAALLPRKLIVPFKLLGLFLVYFGLVAVGFFSFLGIVVDFTSLEWLLFAQAGAQSFLGLSSLFPDDVITLASTWVIFTYLVYSCINILIIVQLLI